MDPMEKERQLLRQIETDPLMEPQEQQKYLNTWGAEGWLLAAEDRACPLHDPQRLPGRWLTRENPLELCGAARPGECYAFQLALYAPEGLGPVALSWTGFGDRLHCINAGGTDCMGRPLHRTIAAAPGRVQPLWFYLTLPEDFHGEIRGEILVTPQGKAPRTAAVRLQVEGELLPRHGDDEPWRHSRLRWLDSTIAQDDGITRPFTPLHVQGRSIRGLGHRVVLGDNGLPEQIQSFLNQSVTGITRTPREILAAPITFAIQTDGGSGLAGPMQVVEQNGGIVRWETARQSGGLAVRTEASMEYDGYLQYRITATATEDVSFANAKLSIPYCRDAARFWMGLSKLGGFRKGELDWKWNPLRNQDTLWMGDVNAGMMVRLRDRRYQKPYMLIYYHYHPLVMPEGWDNGGNGGVRVREQADRVSLEAYSGPRSLRRGESVTFDFDLAITPVKPIDTAEHWHDRYYHDVPTSLKEVSAGGANIINIHHAKALNPYINYPFFETEALADYVQTCHDNGLRVKLYDTVKEISIHTPEFWAFQSLGDEIIPGSWETGSSFQGSVPYADDWLRRHVVENYLTAWRQRINDGDYREELEASVVAAPMSRYNNYFLEGLDWLLKHTGMDGLYFDDVAFDRSVMKRVRKLLDRDHPRCTIDLHSWNYFENNTVDDSSLAGHANSMNLYIDNFAFIDRIWFGEGFDYGVSPDTWLVEMSGIPFGMMGEMLQDGGNVWRGMVFGMTNRLPNPKDPAGMWALWDRFRIADAAILGWWNPDCPVKTDCPEIPVTVYRQPHQCQLALASWSDREEQVELQIDYAALAFDPDRTVCSIPAVPGFQEAYQLERGERIAVPSGKGYVLLLTEE